MGKWMMTWMDIFGIAWLYFTISIAVAGVDPLDGWIERLSMA